MSQKVKKKYEFNYLYYFHFPNVSNEVFDELNKLNLSLRFVANSKKYVSNTYLLN
jgi:hypothetical protein